MTDQDPGIEVDKSNIAEMRVGAIGWLHAEGEGAECPNTSVACAEFVVRAEGDARSRRRLLFRHVTEAVELATKNGATSIAFDAEGLRVYGLTDKATSEVVIDALHLAQTDYGALRLVVCA